MNEVLNKLEERRKNGKELYHSITVDGKRLNGRRNPMSRINKLNTAGKYDFKNKKVLDIGCNIGGMLYDIYSEIDYGLGIDRQENIDFCNINKEFHDYSKLNFKVVNLENINQFKNTISEGFDIVFFLAISMHITTWKELLNLTKKHSKSLLYETNGESSKKQIEHLKTLYDKVVFLGYSEEDSKSKQRELYYCE
jgi:2-polyprenyl-3-methyl-5-hydroxy-6-metoxy-1,4-benzoquinol methylase